MHLSGYTYTCQMYFNTEGALYFPNMPNKHEGNFVNAIAKHFAVSANQISEENAYHETTIDGCVKVFSIRITVLNDLHRIANAENAEFGYAYPPLILINDSNNNPQGFPVFISNKFVRNDLQKLLDFLGDKRIMSGSEITDSVDLMCHRVDDGSVDLRFFSN